MSDVIVGPPTGKFVLSLAANQTMQTLLRIRPTRHPTSSCCGCCCTEHCSPGQATVACVYSAGHKDPHEWPEAATLTDGTDGLQHDGNVRLTVPDDWDAQRPTAAGDDQPGWTNVNSQSEGGGALTEPLHWIGLRIQNNTAAPITAGIDRILFNSAPARNALTIRSPELLGAPTASRSRSSRSRTARWTRPRQPARRCARSDVGDGPADVGRMEGRRRPAGGAASCVPRRPGDGEVMFGNFDDKTQEGHGAIPPDGAPVWARTYRYVAGGHRETLRPSGYRSWHHPAGRAARRRQRRHQPRTGLRRLRRGADRGDAAPRARSAEDPRPRGDRRGLRESRAGGHHRRRCAVRCLYTSRMTGPTAAHGPTPA